MIYCVVMWQHAVTSPTVIRSTDGNTRSDHFIEIICRNDHEYRYKI